MNRRRVLAVVPGSIGLTGCLGPELLSEEPSTPTPQSVNASVKDRVKECETDYIESQLIQDENESITDRSGPIITSAEERFSGAYLEVKTDVGTVRSVEGESDETADYVITAAYLVTDEAVFRTEGYDHDGDPRNGTTVDC